MNAFWFSYYVMDPEMMRMWVLVFVEDSEPTVVSISTSLKGKDAFQSYFQNISTLSGQIKYFVNFVGGVENFKVWIRKWNNKDIPRTGDQSQPNIIVIVN